MESLIPEAVKIDLGKIPLSLAMSWLTWCILGFISFLIIRKPQAAPGRLQSAIELCFERIFALCEEMLGERSRRYFPLFICLFAYLVIGNLIGLVPGLKSPTSDIAQTGALALIVFIYYNVEGLREHGWGYLGHFYGPALPRALFFLRPLFIILELIAAAARPFSLAMRLFCNIFSKELLLGLLAWLFVKFIGDQGAMQKGLALAPLLLRPVIILLGLLLGFIQAYVFVILSLSYVASAIRIEEGNQKGELK